MTRRSVYSFLHCILTLAFIRGWRFRRRVIILGLLILAVMSYALFFVLPSQIKVGVTEDTVFSFPSFPPNSSDQLEFSCMSHKLNTVRGGVLSKGRYKRTFVDCTDTVIVFTVDGLSSGVLGVLTRMFIPYLTINVGRTDFFRTLGYFLSDTNKCVRIIVFEDFASYTGLSQNERGILDNYCRANNVGVIGFLNDGYAFTTEPGSLVNVGNLPLFLHILSDAPSGMYTAKESPVLRVTKSGRYQPGGLKSASVHSKRKQTKGYMTTLVPDSSHYAYFAPLLFTNVGENSQYAETPELQSCVTESEDDQEDLSGNFVYQSLAVEDTGQWDEIHRVLFANCFDSLWINLLVFIDAVVYLSGGRFHLSPPSTVPFTERASELMNNIVVERAVTNLDLARWILVDVDDVFMHGSGVNFTVEDAEAMFAMQTNWRQQIPGFTFNLGFCGQFFERSNGTERLGYEAILAHRSDFWWFDHIWNHYQPHILNETTLMELMEKSKQFAAVLPRQTCGVYSRFVRFSDMTDAHIRIPEMVLGGSLFQKVVLNPISVFMTHLTNYKGDRLALYVFDGLFRFIQAWTNLELFTAKPSDLAELYEERFVSAGARDPPLQTDPCRDSHSRALWPSTVPCGQNAYPSIVIVGPQKTGSTALLHFLRLHPSLKANRYQYGSTFEELQFFSSDSLYSQGVIWYVNQFEHSSSSKSSLNFEKSANYFDHPKAPVRLHALMPHAQLIVLLRNPVDRAYSWYQHALAHHDIAAQLISFSDLLQFGGDISHQALLDLIQPDQFETNKVDSNNKTAIEQIAIAVRHLYHRCVDPGFYAQHLQNWLRYFPAAQILPVNAESLRIDPVIVLDVVQDFLNLNRKVNYSAYLEFDERKKFFCLRPGFSFPRWPDSHLPNQRCLGISKGRIYEPLDRTRFVPRLMHLRWGYSNEDLRRLLGATPIWRWWMNKMGTEYPDWL
ncbi:unnamed protein product [Calicophoron daubneyi]|uniref:[heparan sulfate]-glucosamine N-sulfotransferase n=1 Tax=Calicophoron daubneyi TaxID=300641 RepID=A0AAV2T5K4_CALDB